MSITKEAIEAVLVKHAVYSHYIKGLLKTSGQITISSPFRKEKNPSFSINLDTGMYLDFGADDRGDIYGFVGKCEGITEFPKILELIAKKFTNLPVNNGPQKKQESTVKLISNSLINEFSQNLQENKFPHLNDELKKRKINLKVCKQYQIGVGSIKYYEKKTKKYPEFQTFIFPYQLDDKKNAIQFKKIPYQNGKKQQAFIRTRGSATIFPKDQLQYKKLIVCEGEMDALALISHGFNAVTGTAGAGTFASNKKLLSNFKDKEITILFDDDNPGKNFSELTAEGLKGIAKSVVIAKWNKDIEGFDVGDFFKNNGTVEQLKIILKSAKSFKEEKSLKQIKLKEAEWFFEEMKSGGYKLIQNRVVDYLQKTYYQDEKNRSTLCSSILGSKRYFFVYQNGYWHKTNKEHVKRVVYKILEHPFTNNAINSIVDMLLSLVYVDEETFNSRHDLINLNNCAYDLVNYEAIPHNPEHFFTCKNDYDYDIDAACPNWDKALQDYSLNDKTWIKAMWEIFGYSLTGKYEIQKMFWWSGTGGTGKSTTSIMLQRLVGTGLTRFNFDPAKLSGRFYNKPLIGKRIAITGDLDNFLMNINIIKQLTGNDRQTTDVKGGDEIEFENTAKIIFLMNQMPQIPAGESIQPFLRRIHILPFNYKIKIYDSDIDILFKKEMSGVFNKAIIGLKQLRDNKNEFQECKRGNDLLTFYSRNVNIFASFCNDEIVVDKKDNVWGFEIWEKYQEYMDERAGPHWESDRSYIRSLTTLGARIKAKFDCDSVQESKVRYDKNREIKRGRYTKYLGIRLATDKDYGLEVNDEPVEEDDADVQDNLPGF